MPPNLPSGFIFRVRTAHRMNAEAKAELKDFASDIINHQRRAQYESLACSPSDFVPGAMSCVVRVDTSRAESAAVRRLDDLRLEVHGIRTAIVSQAAVIEGDVMRVD